MIRRILLILVAIPIQLNFIIISKVEAQQDKEIKALEMEAGKAFASDAYAEALPMYQILDSLKPKEAKTIARIGICYLFLPSKYKALPYLEKARDLNYTKDGLEYYLGRAYHLKHQFDKAIENYSAYKKTLSHGVLKSKEKLKEINDLIGQCYVGEKLVKSPVEASIENLGVNINSIHSDFAPVITADENTLMFSSRRPNSGRKDENGNYYEDIYISNKINKEWEKPRSIGPPVNTKVNDASIGLSLDGGQLFLYKNDTSELDYSGGDIFESDLINGKWSRPKRLNKNINSDHWEPSASLIADESILFFSSDRPGGYGGTDIYLSRKQKNNTWGPAKNLGPTINSPYDEDAPFIHPDSKTLYFSSNGAKSMGGFDIFTTHYNKLNDSVQEPVNIGYPVNTADDELFFVWSADGKRGYFSASKEDGQGEEDIYMVLRPNVKIDLVLLNGKIHAKDKNIPAKIRLINNETNELVALYDSTKFHENYTILLDPGKNYTISIECDKYLSHSENIVAPLNGFFKIEKDIEMKPLDKGGAVALNNVFFDMGSALPKKESFHELDRYYNLLSSKKELMIEIANHTYDLGNDHDGNQQLSQKRADIIAEYIIKKGMDKSRVKAYGYGDKFNLQQGDSVQNSRNNTRTDLIIVHNLTQGPMAAESRGYYSAKENLINLPGRVSNKSERIKSAKNTVATAHHAGEVIYPSNATKEEREKILQNFIRRKVSDGTYQPVVVEGTVTDFATSKPIAASIELTDENHEVLAKLKSNSSGKFSIATYQASERICTLSVKKNGYNFYVQVLHAPANSNEKHVIAQNMFLKKLEVGTKFTLRNIYYGFNKTTIQRESYSELQHLEKMLKRNSQIKIEIAGHTDSKGPELYNKILSQRRAQAVADYLKKSGIQESRIKAIGYGEEVPLASNDDEPEGRELNRRTEIHIIEK